MADKKATAKQLDFTNVKERNFNTKHLPEGDYPAKILSVQDHKSKAGNPMWLFTIGLTGGGAGAKGASYPYYCGLDTDSLWKVRNLFAACGINVPKKRVAVDPNKIVNRPLGVTLEDDEYEGKPKSVISGVMPVSEVGTSDDDDEDEDDVEPEVEEDDEDEEPAPKAKKAKSKTAPAEDEDDDTEVTEDELDELEIEEV